MTNIIFPCISLFTTMNFITFESTANYTESNLGFTGRIIFDCFRGTCGVEHSYYDSSKDYLSK